MFCFGQNTRGSFAFGESTPGYRRVTPPGQLAMTTIEFIQSQMNGDINIAYVNSGFGDGTGPMYKWMAGDECVGMLQILMQLLIIASPGQPFSG